MGTKGRPDDWKSDERTSKFLPAFNAFISDKKVGMVSETYTETDYEYRISYDYNSGAPQVKIDPFANRTIVVLDNTVESQEG